MTDVLPAGLALLVESLSSELQNENPDFWESHDCEMGYDDWMRTIHYHCALGGAYTQDTITFEARVVAQPGTHILNKADLKWYY